MKNSETVGYVTIPVTERDIESVIVNGLEGAIGYWAKLDNTRPEWQDKPKGEPTSMWATKLILEGKALHFEDTEDPSEKWELTLSKVIEGITQNNKERTWDSSIENGDAETMDCIIQYALFGELVYG